MQSFACVLPQIVFFHSCRINTPVGLCKSMVFVGKLRSSRSRVIPFQTWTYTIRTIMKAPTCYVSAFYFTWITCLSSGQQKYQRCLRVEALTAKDIRMLVKVFSRKAYEDTHIGKSKNDDLDWIKLKVRRSMFMLREATKNAWGGAYAWRQRL